MIRLVKFVSYFMELISALNSVVRQALRDSERFKLLGSCAGKDENILTMHLERCATHGADMPLNCDRFNIMQLIAAKLLDECKVGSASFSFEELEWTKDHTAVVIIIDEPTERVYARVTTPEEMRDEMVRLKEQIQRREQI